MVYLTDRISSRENITLLFIVYLVCYICRSRRLYSQQIFFIVVFYDSRRNKHPRCNIRCFPNETLREKN